MVSDAPLPLIGCTPTPLASYLKALGVLRLLSEQRPEANVRGAWERGCFVLCGKVTREELTAFFLNDYAPTPIMAPWNGGSGFFPKDNREAINAIRAGKAERLTIYRDLIARVKGLLDTMDLAEKPTPEQKAALLLACRNRLPEAALDWLDSAYILTEDGAKYPPLLGTGGNDGRLEFTNNFMQRLGEVFNLGTGASAEKSAAWLGTALFGDTAPVLVRGAFGQFSPGASGGANASTGFDSHSATNPWDYILMMEGAVLFAAAAVKRLESTAVGQMAYPFCVRQSGVGYGSAALSDEENSRCEMWMPLWEQPAGLEELRALLSEGRAQVNGRPARHGVDFARAVASLGVDRGISAFQRYGFQVRNGLSYFATPLERVPVRRNQLATQLLGPLDEWLDRFRRAAHGMAPSSAVRAAQRLESAIMAFCKNSDPHRTQEMLIALGRCERTMAGSQKWALEAFLRPIPLLQPRWLSAADTHTAEYRLAASLAGLTGPIGKTWLPLRSQLEPVFAGRKDDRRWYSWQENASRDVVWHAGPLAGVLNSILARRVMLASRNDRLADTSYVSARLPDLAAFIEKRTDDRLLASLLWGLSLVDFGAEYGDDFKLASLRDDCEPPAFYALLKLCFSRHAIREVEVPLVSAIHRRAVTGDGAGASELAIRRLRASGLRVAIGPMQLRGEPIKRAAAALLFPLNAADTHTLAERVLRPSETETKTTATLA